MFDTPAPRVFFLPCGVDFPVNLVAGLRARMVGKPPEAMASVRLYLNSERMLRRVREVFAAGGTGFLPQLKIVTDLAQDAILAGLPPAIPALRRKLELTQLISRLLDGDPSLAPRAALFDLADSLATLLDEMQSEAVSPETVSALDVSNHSAHWRRTQEFLRIVTPFFAEGALHSGARQRLAADRLARLWQTHPPLGPVIVAGSTGSRGATSVFMQAVAKLPQGALVLPGFDTDIPAAVWASMRDALTAEDHPQFRYRRLMDALGMTPADLRPWHGVGVPSPDRNRLISLSLRPAPVTDQWLVEGQHLPDLKLATAGVTLIEAPNTRTEAVAIALILRQAAENGTRAALVCADRNLTRQVAAALGRWGIIADDSAGAPLGLSPTGRLLRHVAGLFGQVLTADVLLAILKHPLTGSGGDRGNHLRFTRDLELKLRRHGPVFPVAQTLTDWAATRKDADVGVWALGIAAALQGVDALGLRPLSDHVAHHIQLAETLASGTGSGGAGKLWDKAAGIEAQKLVVLLTSEAPHGGPLSAADYRNLFDTLITAGEVREAQAGHPHISIFGPRESREMGADLVILGGLNDGVWPRLGTPDPWLNRQMRKDAGLLLPERQIGLSAHDYQQAMAAPRVVMTRAMRDADALTVPSRWLNRLMNLMNGLPDQHGDVALKAMQARGLEWLRLVDLVEAPSPAMRADPRLQPATRPQPRPPVSARPDGLSLTSIATLIRDPYAIYARYILRLRPLDPLRAPPDPRDRGVVFHEILARFVKSRPKAETRPDARLRLLRIAAEVLLEETPFPAARTLWLARMDRAAEHFLTQDSKRDGTPLIVETAGQTVLDTLPFTLFGTPDRIDLLPDGRLQLIDYKTGTPPTAAQQRHFDKQLLLAAAMAERGGFAELGPSEVALISYIGLGATQKVEDTDITEDLITEVWTKFNQLITAYFRPATGYTARRALFEQRHDGDYDHLSRYGEWQTSDAVPPEAVGGNDAG